MAHFMESPSESSGKRAKEQTRHVNLIMFVSFTTSADHFQPFE